MPDAPILNAARDGDNVSAEKLGLMEVSARSSAPSTPCRAVKHLLHIVILFRDW